MNVVTDFSKKIAIKSMRVATAKTVITVVANPFINDSGFRSGYYQMIKSLHFSKQQD